VRPFLAMLCCTLLGCAARRAGDVVGRVTFDGNDPPPGLSGLLAPQTDRALRTAIQHPKPALFSSVPLDRAMLDQDAWRLEVWYANHGYFDARFLGWDLIRAGGTDARPRWRVHGRVDQGPLSVVRSVHLEGIDGFTAPMRARLRATVTLAEGDAWDTGAWKETEEALRTFLQERSYAYARVESDVAVHADADAVDVTLRVLPGPACRFGPVTLPDTPHVPEAALRDAVPIREGDEYHASLIGRTRDALFGLRAFSVVDVVPDLSNPSSRTVPVRIEAREGPTREVALGPEIEVETGKGAGYVSATYTNDNVASRLWRLRSSARAGLASVLTVTDTESSAWSPVRPVGEARLSMELPRVPARGFTPVVDGSLRYDVEPGYAFFTPELSPSIAWRPHERFTVRAGYRISYFRFLETSVDVSDIADAPPGVDAASPYFLSMLEQSATYDGRNHPIRTTRGWYWTAALAEAGGPLGGRYSFLRARGEVRTWRSVVRLFGWDPDAVVAGRLGAGLIVPSADLGLAAVPLPERLYLGGGTSVRGWASDRLGPYEVVTADDGTTTVVPSGGLAQAWGTVELRKALPFDFGGVLFADVGRTWATLPDLLVEPPLVSVGGGLRYDTAIGPLRADVGVRLGPHDAFDDVGYPRVTAHLGLTEAF
jgi:translocation and assembly module TamA